MYQIALHFLSLKISQSFIDTTISILSLIASVISVIFAMKANSSAKDAKKSADEATAQTKTSIVKTDVVRVSQVLENLIGEVKKEAPKKRWEACAILCNKIHLESVRLEQSVEPLFSEDDKPSAIKSLIAEVSDQSIKLEEEFNNASVDKDENYPNSVQVTLTKLMANCVIISENIGKNYD